MQNPIHLASIETFPLEAPVERPVRNSFRTLTSRSALVVRVTDANQRWTVAETLEAIRNFEEFGLEWLEEPMPADVPLPEWQALAKASPIATLGERPGLGYEPDAELLAQYRAKPS